MLLLKEERYSQAVKNLEFDRQLGPYTLSQYGDWKRLSNYITKSIIERVGKHYLAYDLSLLVQFYVLRFTFYVFGFGLVLLCLFIPPYNNIVHVFISKMERRGPPFLIPCCTWCYITYAIDELADSRHGMPC